MLKTKPNLDRIGYVNRDTDGVWRPSTMRADIADELLRRLEWRPDETAAEMVSDNMRIPTSFLEEA